MAKSPRRQAQSADTNGGEAKLREDGFADYPRKRYLNSPCILVISAMLKVDEFLWKYSKGLKFVDKPLKQANKACFKIQKRDGQEIFEA